MKNIITIKKEQREKNRAPHGRCAYDLEKPNTDYDDHSHNSVQF
jgi:hypothetical protein